MLADADPLRYLAEVKKPAVSVAPRHTQDQTVRAHACRVRRIPAGGMGRWVCGDAREARRTGLQFVGNGNAAAVVVRETARDEQVAGAGMKE